MALFTKRLEGRQWMPFISVSGPVQEEVALVFYVNMFNINNEDLSFWTMVCNPSVHVSSTILSKIFGVPHLPIPLDYPIHRLSLEKKGGMIQNLCEKFLNWPD